MVICTNTFKFWNRYLGLQVLPLMALYPQAWEMEGQVQKATRVLWFHESKFVVTVQRRFLTKFWKEVLKNISIYKWYKLFSEVGFICKRKTQAKVNEVQAAFLAVPGEGEKGWFAWLLTIPQPRVQKKSANSFES